MKNINKTILFVQSFLSYILKCKIVFHEYYFHIFFIHTIASNCKFLLTIQGILKVFSQEGNFNRGLPTKGLF